MVRAARKAHLQSAELGVRAGLDGALRADRDRGLATWEHGTRAAFAVWLAQLIVNFAWSPTFFRAHRGDVALALILALLALILAFIGLQWTADRSAALLFVPYAAWVAFATALNAALLRLNGAAVRGGT